MLPEDEIYNLCIHVPGYPYCILATKIHNGVYGNVIEESTFFSNNDEEIVNWINTK